ILDFGLARAFQGPGAESAGSETSPTITPNMTRAGSIMGTAAYMSPEQVRGKSADARADVWSFGCLMFEMVSGTRCFPGETAAESMGAILHTDPDWKALPESTPEPLRRLLVRCLAKDPRRRLQAIGEARLALEDMAT